MLKDLGIISEWMEESEARGVARGVRQVLLHVLERRFGTVPEALQARIEAAEPEWCHALLDQALSVESFEELQTGLQSFLA
jgi:hypothetical protein